MKKLFCIVTMLILIPCFVIARTNDTDTNWAGAEWIAYEKMDDSMKVVPAVHGSGDDLGNKGLKRSVVPMFRRDFTVGKTVKKAMIDISGLGHYELHINGKKIGDRFLSPGWTYYQKRCFYNSYDITDYVEKGNNAIGVLVGNGFFNVNRERYRKLVVAYGYPQLIFRIHVQYTDGSTSDIVSDSTCRVTASPITFSSIYGGEDYDARLEQNGWDRAGFNDTSWRTPVIIDNVSRQLDIENDHPLKIMEIFPAKNITKKANGKLIYDFAQNASGIIALKVRGDRGTVIKIRPDELLGRDGKITQRSGGGPYEFNYTLKGGGIETWQPRFTYYGFRYAEVEIIGAEGADSTEIVELTMLHTRNSAPSVGTFACSDTLFNRIFELINWGIKSNMASVATDCPHREKLGWLEQTYLIGPSMHYNFDIHSLYRKVVDDMIDSQLENGLVPDIAPEYVPFAGGFRDSPEWGSAAVIIPWQIYEWYGDTDIIARAYPMMKRYVDYLDSMSKEHILDYGLGDWFDLGPGNPGYAQLTPIPLTATAIYYYDLALITKMARMLGHDSDYKKYDALSREVRAAFLAKFYNPDTGICATGSQTAYAMSLYTGLIPEKDQEKVLGNLLDVIRNNDYALTSGDIGYHFLVRVLSENGKSDTLYRMNRRSDRPGYGYQLEKGATSLTESWAALPTVSNNHMMLGHLMEWFYSGLGGIYQAENSIAYSDIIIAPKPVADISWVKCTYNSVKGEIISEWKTENGTFSLDITVPENASAKIMMPEGFTLSSCESAETGPVASDRTKSGRTAINVQPGKYSIVAVRN